MNISKRLFKYFIIFSVAIMICVLAIGSVVINNFKKSAAYKKAVSNAMSNEDIKLRTGGIRGVGYLVGGELTDSSASLSFTVKGIERDLDVYYDLTKDPKDSWVVKDFSLEE